MVGYEGQCHAISKVIKGHFSNIFDKSRLLHLILFTCQCFKKESMENRESAEMFVTPADAPRDRYKVLLKALP